MAFHSDAAANALLSGGVASMITGSGWLFDIFTGGAPSDGNAALTGRTKLIGWTLATNPVGTVSNRQASISATQVNALALASGNAGIGVLYQTGDDLTQAAGASVRRIIGTVGGPGSGADFELAGGVAIVANEPLSLSLTYRLPV